MYYITGDTHGNQIIWKNIDDFLKPDDTIIVAGDFGIGFWDGPYWPEEMFFDYLEEQKYTVLFLDGNHEDFNKLNKNYEISMWNNGHVHFIRKNVIHLMRGEIYEIDGHSMFVMGGGYSLDKARRIENVSWWPGEMPSEEEYKNASRNLERKGYKVDYILTHTAPCNTIDYLSRTGKGVMNTLVDEYPLNGFLQWVEDKAEYKKWYFGHFHLDVELWKNEYVLFDGIRELCTGKLVKMRR